MSTFDFYLNKAIDFMQHQHERRISFNAADVLRYLMDHYTEVPITLSSRGPYGVSAPAPHSEFCKTEGLQHYENTASSVVKTQRTATLERSPFKESKALTKDEAPVYYLIQKINQYIASKKNAEHKPDPQLNGNFALILHVFNSLFPKYAKLFNPQIERALAPPVDVFAQFFQARQKLIEAYRSIHYDSLKHHSLKYDVETIDCICRLLNYCAGRNIDDCPSEILEPGQSEGFTSSIVGTATRIKEGVVITGLSRRQTSSSKSSVLMFNTFGREAIDVPYPEHIRRQCESAKDFVSNADVLIRLKPQKNSNSPTADPGLFRRSSEHCQYFGGRFFVSAAKIENQIQIIQTERAHTINLEGALSPSLPPTLIEIVTSYTGFL